MLFTPTATFTVTGTTTADFIVKLNGVTIPSTLHTVAPGTGSDAGNLVVSFIIKTDGVVGAYIGVDGSNTYNAGDVALNSVSTATVTTAGTTHVADSDGNTIAPNVADSSN